MTIWPSARRCSARRSYNVGAIDGAKPSHPETSAIAGCGPEVSGRKVRYCASGVWATLADADRSSTATAARTTIAPHPADMSSIAPRADRPPDSPNVAFSGGAACRCNGLLSGSPRRKWVVASDRLRLLDHSICALEHGRWKADPLRLSSSQIEH